MRSSTSIEEIEIFYLFKEATQKTVELPKNKYELSNHLGNVLVTTSDLRKGADNNADGKADYYNAIVTSANDYFAFGSLMPARQFNSTIYKWGFNGKENDNEVKGEGNQVAFEARIYDSRLGRWLSTDPREVEYAWQSTYAYYMNCPIAQIDYLGGGDGDEPNLPESTSQTVAKVDYTYIGSEKDKNGNVVKDVFKFVETITTTNIKYSYNKSEDKVEKTEVITTTTRESTLTRTDQNTWVQSAIKTNNTQSIRGYHSVTNGEGFGKMMDNIYNAHPEEFWKIEGVWHPIGSAITYNITPDLASLVEKQSTGFDKPITIIQNAVDLYKNMMKSEKMGSTLYSAKLQFQEYCDKIAVIASFLGAPIGNNPIAKFMGTKTIGIIGLAYTVQSQLREIGFYNWYYQNKSTNIVNKVY